MLSMPIIMSTVVLSSNVTIMFSGSYKIGNNAVRKASKTIKPVSHKGAQITKVKKPEVAVGRISSLVSTSGHTKSRRQNSIKTTKASKFSESHAQRLHGLQKSVKM